MNDCPNRPQTLSTLTEPYWEHSLDLESIASSLGVKYELIWAQFREVLALDQGFIIKT